MFFFRFIIHVTMKFSFPVSFLFSASFSPFLFKIWFPLSSHKSHFFLLCFFLVHEQHNVFCFEHCKFHNFHRNFIFVSLQMCFYVQNTISTVFVSAITPCPSSSINPQFPRCKMAATIANKFCWRNTISKHIRAKL